MKIELDLTRLSDQEVYELAANAKKEICNRLSNEIKFEMDKFDSILAEIDREYNEKRKKSLQKMLESLDMLTVFTLHIGN